MASLTLTYKVPFSQTPVYSQFSQANVIGKGSSSVIYKQTLLLRPISSLDTSSSRALDIAIKTIAVKEQYFLERALGEVQILQKIGHHPNIIGFYGYMMQNNICTISMEFFPGRNLHEQFVRSNIDTPLRIIFSIGKQIGSAIARLETLGVIHGDVKTDNILYDANQGLAKLIDFGISVDTTTTDRDSHPRFAISFRPPELILKYPSTTGSDTWALGLTLFLTYTKRYLFSAPDESAPRGLLAPHDILCCQNEVIGPPSIEFLRNCREAHLYFKENSTELISSGAQATPELHYLSEKFSIIDRIGQRARETPEKIDTFQRLLWKMLVWSPHERIRPENIGQEVGV